MEKTERQQAEERFTKKDIIQICVGSFAGTIYFIFSSEIIQIADSLTFEKIILVAVLSIAVAFFAAYFIGVRKLGHRKIMMLFGFVPVRIVIQYFFALLFAAFLLYLFDINTAATAMGTAVKRIIMLAMPALVAGSAVDLLDSQKNA